VKIQYILLHEINTPLINNIKVINSEVKKYYNIYKEAALFIRYFDDALATQSILTSKRNIAADWIVFLLRTRKASGSNFGPKTGYTDLRFWNLLSPSTKMSGSYLKL
jgi:hypothetical protein